MIREGRPETHMHPHPPRTRTPAPPPGRVVATLHVDEPPSTGHVARPPIDARVYDDWTAEAEREAAEAPTPLAPAVERAPAEEEITLEPSTDADARATPAGAWLLVAGLGLTGVTLLVGGAVAALAAFLGLAAWVW
jgi:hypothetical protein